MVLEFLSRAKSQAAEGNNDYKEYLDLQEDTYD